MPQRRPERQLPVICRVLTMGAAAAFLFEARPADAQGFFDALFRMFRAPYQTYQPDMPPRPGINPLQPRQPAAPQERGMSKPAAPRAAYCVRLCDGRYFPLPNESGTTPAASQNRCSAMCPAAETRVFSGNDIEGAASADGKHYTALANAFLYRERAVTGCTCRNDGRLGLVLPDVRDDPTLRRGDIVVTRQGPMVFTGDGKPPHPSRKFVAAETYRGLPKSVRQTLADIKVADDPPSAEGDQPVTTGRAVGSTGDYPAIPASARPAGSRRTQPTEP